MSALFVVMLGGRHPRANIEVHDIAITLGDTLEDTYPHLKQAWFGDASALHIDAWWKVQGVTFEDRSYRIEFTHTQPQADDLKLYLINLGGYVAAEFGEQHRYVLVVAKNAQQAKQQGKQHYGRDWQKQHVDRVVDVDDCIEIDHVQGRYVQLVESDYEQNHWENCYIILS